MLVVCMQASSVATAARPAPSYRWVMLGALCLIYLSHNIVASAIAPLIAPISDDLGVSRTSMGAILGAWPLVYIFTAFPAGTAIDRFGLKRSLLAGIAFILLSELLRAAAVNQLFLLVAVAAFGLGGPFVSVGAPKLVSSWFPEKEVAGALGIYSIASSLGRIAAVSTANAIVMPLTGYNWRLTLLVYGAVVGVAALIWLLVAKDLPSGERSSAAGGHHGAFSGAVAMSLVRERSVQIILVMTLGTFLYSHAMSDWLPEVLRASGMTASDSGLWATIPTFAGIATALTLPRWVPPSWRLRVLVIIFGLGFAGPFLVAFSGGAPQALGLVLIGMRLGAMTPLLLATMMTVPAVTPARMGAAGGLYFTVGEVGGVLGPLVMGWLADLSGGFTGGMVTLAMVSLISLGLTLVLQTAVRAPQAAVGTA